MSIGGFALLGAIPFALWLGDSRGWLVIIAVLGLLWLGTIGSTVCQTEWDGRSNPAFCE